MSQMEKSFEPSTFETKWYRFWEESGCFKPAGKGPAYTIMLPPPNVTGTLHMGHAFQHTLQDALIRYHRMRGYDTLWQMGTDHAGIATEMVVSRNLALEGKGETRDSLGREKFIEKVWEWKQESGDTIERQMRRLGSSGDWSRTVFTMDPMPSEAVVETFVRLYEEGLIYRGQRLVNWDPVLKTAISDLEVVSEEEDGFLWSIAYPLSDGSGQLVVATTRPETMLADVAVMVHPEDERYAHLVGKTVRLPLCNREITIIADEYVDREFGTGVVKVTPGHDKNDYAVWTRHVDTGLFDILPNRGFFNVFTPSAKLIHGPDNWRETDPSQSPEGAKNVASDTTASLAKTDIESMKDAIFQTELLSLVPEKYRGMDRFEARKSICADLEEAGLLVEKKPHKLQQPRGDRTGQVIEFYPTTQWFMRMDKLGARGLELVENGSVRFVPENWINTYRHWMGNIQDWCISRQLWWGHRIPAWFDDAGHVYVARDEQEAIAQAAAKSGGVPPSLRRDNDVLETWFSSALWSHSTLGWPNEQAMAERGYDRYLPTSVLVTGFDIIFFWVARMIMMTDHFTGTVPFKDVYITGLVRDRDGQKMSKSKGNVLDPIDIIDGITLDALIAKRTTGLMKPTDAPKIEKATRKEYPEGIAAFGADALRFTFASLATHGRDIKFDLQRCEGYKNFCNKLWNAARFALMNCEGKSFSGEPEARSSIEKSILSRYSRMCGDVHKHFAEYRFDLASQALYEFTWNEFCDWFLELAKKDLNGDDTAAGDSMRHTLLHVLEGTLRALHPLIPFVTEEIWQHVAPKLGRLEKSISLCEYPELSNTDTETKTAADADFEWLKAVVSSIRKIRGEMNIKPSATLDLLYSNASKSDIDRIRRLGSHVVLLTGARGVGIEPLQGEAPAAATAVIGDLRLLIPLAGLIDLDAEKIRLDKEITRVEGEIGKCQAKLEKFGPNTPAAVVDQERTRLADWSRQLAALSEQRGKL